MEMCSNKILDALASDYAELNTSSGSKNTALLSLVPGLADWIQFQICVLCKQPGKPGIPAFCTLVSVSLFAK